MTLFVIILFPRTGNLVLLCFKTRPRRSPLWRLILFRFFRVSILLMLIFLLLNFMSRGRGQTVVALSTLFLRWNGLNCRGTFRSGRLLTRGSGRRRNRRVCFLFMSVPRDGTVAVTVLLPWRRTVRRLVVKCFRLVRGVWGIVFLLVPAHSLRW